MTPFIRRLLVLLGCALSLSALLAVGKNSSVTVPFTLEHNRMLVEVEFQRADGSFRKARVWVDTGNPGFFMSEELARDVGIDVAAAKAKAAEGRIEIPPPAGARIGRMPLKFEGIKSTVMSVQPPGMHIDGNLPSTLFMQYHVIFDYPKLRLTLAEPGSLKPRGVRVPALIHPKTGIFQLDVVMDGERHSFAVDNGATYSFTSNELVARLSEQHPTWPRLSGALGCANMWGWPQDAGWPLLRFPEIQLGDARLAHVAMAGIRKEALEWYSQKTARPVTGLLGPNVLKAFRVEIDYAGSAVYLEKAASFNAYDMDLVGLTLRPESDGSFTVIGVAARDARSAVEGVEAGDKLLQVDKLQTSGATMAAVVDALRGKPGDTRTLLVERKGQRFSVNAKVDRFL